MPRAYYNENDPRAAHVLRALIFEGLIARGVIDTRSIKDVTPDDVKGFTQCHFFAGYGGWSIAARLAGWPDNEPLWTGSCPCQPFSVAGKGAGTDDARHLWPDFHRLIDAARPPVIVGEQVAGASGRGWFDGVAADLEGSGYACRAVDIPACAVDAPHIRQRLYWCALAGSPSERRGEGRAEHELRSGRAAAPGADGTIRHVGDGIGAGLEGQRRDDHGAPGRQVQVGPSAAPDDRNGSFYAGAAWLACHDGKARRAKPGVRDVAHGHAGRIDSGDDPGGSVAPKIPQGLLVKNMPGRIDLWRLAGNGLVLPLAAEVIASLMDVLDMQEAA